MGNPQPGQRLKYLPSLLAGVIVLVVAAGGWWYWQRTHPPTPAPAPPGSTGLAVYSPIDLTGKVQSGADGRSVYLTVDGQAEPYFINNLSTSAVAEALAAHAGQPVSVKARLVIAQTNQLFVTQVDGKIVDQLKILPAFWNTQLTANQHSCLARQLPAAQLTDALTNNLQKLAPSQVQEVWDCALLSENQ